MRVHTTSIPEQRAFDGRPFPLVWSPEGPCTLDQALAWLAGRQDALRQELLEHGAVLLRGFPVRGPEDFDAVVRAARFQGMPYIGGAAPRTDVHEGRVLTTNESPPEEPIPFHHEMSQVPSPPAYVIFYCDLPPGEGGETPIVLSSRVYQRFRAANPAFADRLEATGARYVRVMPDADDDSSPIGRSWRATFLTDDRAAAEARMAEMGMDWRWLDGGDLYTVTRALPAIRTDARSGQKTFFNSVVAAYTGWVDSRNEPTRAVRCGDDTPVDGDALLATARAMQEECVAFRWRAGDVLMIDNQLVMHSRRPFTGPRRILASIARALLLLCLVGQWGCRPDPAPEGYEELVGYLFEHAGDEEDTEILQGLDNLDAWLQGDNLAAAEEGVTIQNLPIEAVQDLAGHAHGVDDLAGVSLVTESGYGGEVLMEALTQYSFADIMPDTYITYDRTFEQGVDCIVSRECLFADGEVYSVADWGFLGQVESVRRIEFRWVESDHGWVFLQRWWLTEPSTGSALDLRIQDQYYIGVNYPTDSGTQRIHASWIQMEMSTGDTSEGAANQLINGWENDAEDLDLWISENL